MYSDIKSVQILIALLKQFNIRRIVCSPGNRNVPIVHSLEQDTFFETYSIVDERSAAFFGLGLIQRFKTPIAICCTSGTAVCNYYSGVCEAFYQRLPLLLITADRNPYYLNQDEEQMIPQTLGFEKVTKHIAALPIVKDEQDEYICARKVNEALLALQHHGQGPVQINIPLEGKLAAFHVPELPPCVKISRYLLEDSWQDCVERLSHSKVLIIYGQAGPLPGEAVEKLELFLQSFDAVLAVDHLANLTCQGTVSTFLLSRVIDSKEFLDNLCPDIVITLNGRYLSYIRNFLKNCRGKFEHWTVNENGDIVDPFSCLRLIFECKGNEFITKILSMLPKELSASHSYKEKWAEVLTQLNPDDIEPEWSDLAAIRLFIKNIQPFSKLHLANSSSVRLVSNYALPPTVEVFCNRGVNGIDGCMSSFVGMSQEQNELCYLIIGDLSFFYDMNALWCQYIHPKMRIILNNNYGATLFHYTVGVQQVPSLDKNIAAEHHTNAQAWVETRGFHYIPVRCISDMQYAIEVMGDRASKKPIFVEIFTDKEQDALVLKSFYKRIRKQLKFGKYNILNNLFKI